MPDSCTCLNETNRGFQQHNGHIRVLVDGATGCEVPMLKVVRLDRTRPAPQPRLTFCPFCGTRYGQIVTAADEGEK